MCVCKVLSNNLKEDCGKPKSLALRFLDTKAVLNSRKRFDKQFRRCWTSSAPKPARAPPRKRPLRSKPEPSFFEIPDSALEGVPICMNLKVLLLVLLGVVCVCVIVFAIFWALVCGYHAG